MSFKNRINKVKIWITDHWYPIKKGINTIMGITIKPPPKAIGALWLDLSVGWSKNLKKTNNGNNNLKDKMVTKKDIVVEKKSWFSLNTEIKPCIFLKFF